MARKKSEFLSAVGKMFEIWRLIVNEVLELGGGDEHLSNLLVDPTRIHAIAKVVVFGVVKAENKRKFLFLPIPDRSPTTSRDEMIHLYSQLAGREPTEADGRSLLANQHLIPEEYRKQFLCLVITGWCRPNNPDHVAYLTWDNRQWVFSWGSLRVFGTDAVIIRLGD